MLNPIFIIGNPRSGTTLLRVILNAHPQLLVPPECGFAMWLYPQFKHKDISRKEVISDFISALKKTRKFETWMVDTQQLLFHLLKVVPKTYSELVDNVYRFYGNYHKIDFKRWGDKNNFYLNFISEINEVFPGAQFIHIVRDGRDVATSYLKLSSRQINSKYRPKLPANIKDIAIEWSSNNRKIEQSFAQIEGERKILVHHEDVILNFIPTITSITKFLNIPFDQKMCEFEDSEKAREPEEFMQWKRKLYGKLDNSSVERYKTELSTKQIKLFNSIAKQTL